MVVLVLYGCLASAPSAAYAQDSEPSALELPSVVVERERTVAESENERDSTGAVTTIERKELDRPGENLDQVLDRQAGVSAVRLGGLGDFSAASIRGSSFDQVLVFLDGIPLNAGLGGAVDLSALPLSHIERMEIYRGFAPVEATASALGGAVFLSTRELEKKTLSARGGYGSFNTISAGLFGGGLIDFTGNEKTRMAAGLDFMHSRGNFSFRNNNGTALDPSDDFDQKFTNRDFDRVGTLFKVTHDFTPRARGTFLQDFFYREGGLQRGGAVITTRSRLQLVRSITGVEFRLRDAVINEDSLRLQAYYTFSQTELDDPLGEFRGFPQDEIKKSYSPGTSVTWRGGHGAIRGTTHFSYRFERYSPAYRIPTVFTDGTSDRQSVAWALGGELEMPGAKLLVAPQYRYEHAWNSFRPASTSSPLNPQKVRQSGGGHSVRGGLLWKPVDGFKLRGNAGRAFRFPSLFELFGDSALIAGNPHLKPEKGLNLDSGFELTRNHELIAAKAGITFFYQDVDNLIQFVRTLVLTRPENVDRATIKGVESSLSVTALAAFRLDATHTWLTSRIRSKVAARDGRKIPFRPPNQWLLRGAAFRERLFSWMTRAELWTELEFTSSHFVDGNNMVSVPERRILGAGLELKLLDDRLELAFDGRNLTNEQVMDVVGFPLPGRTFFGRLGWKFL